jgi:2-oxoisovalerate dehydrogenase E1 component
MVELLRQMILARCIDVVEEELAASGEVFFQVSGAGHEATAVLSRHLGPEDWLHCHYRDKALMLARGLTLAAFFDGVFCNARSHSAGRQMSAHLSAPELKILSIVAPVGNHALQAVGIAQAVRDQEAAPIVLCSSGEGTTQEGEFLEAVAEAVRSKAPVLFWIANNGLAISTRTAGKTFFSPPDGDAGSFHGVPILRLRGSDVLGCDAMARELVAAMRRDRRPRIVVMDVPRLCNHTSADDESLYRSTHELLETLDENDPVFSFANTLMSNGLCDADLTRLLETSMAEVRAAMKDSMAVVEHPPLGAVKRQLDSSLTSRDAERRGKSTAPPVTMLEAFRGVLRQRLVSNPSTFLYGEDIEDPKGDVFRLTAGLSTSFPTRVVSSPLSESTIVGTCIGRALAGQRPVAFIQFADFLPLAFNQIVSELATMHWRTNGGWSCPLVIMAPCGAYRPGLGPFHAQTFESSLAHEPGLDVAVPSTAADASGILNAAFAGARPTVILYPKALLNTAPAPPRPMSRAIWRPSDAREPCAAAPISPSSAGATPCPLPNASPTR